MTTDAFGLLDGVMSYYVADVTNRVLGQVDLYAPTPTVLAYWQDPRAAAEWGNPQIMVVANRGPSIVAPWVIFLAKGITYGQDQNGDGLTTSIWFWGNSTGVTTVGSRYQWWRTQFTNLRTNLMNRVSASVGTASVPISGPLAGIIGAR